MRKSKTCGYTMLQRLSSGLRARKCFRLRNHDGPCMDKYGPIPKDET